MGVVLIGLHTGRTASSVHQLADAAIRYHEDRLVIPKISKRDEQGVGVMRDIVCVR